MKTIGLMGGMGWEASATYYRVINREIRARLGGWHSGRIILDSLDFHAIASAQQKKDFEQVRTQVVDSARRLEAAGAEFLVIACNTVHRFANSVTQAVSIPLLHIADPTGQRLRGDEHRRVGLLGTDATMQGRFYRQRLKERFELDVVVPEQEERRLVNKLIETELAAGSAPQACATQLHQVIAKLAAQGCTAVALACTEFGLAFGSVDKPLIDAAIPLYDTAILHAVAAVDRALI